MILYRGQDLTSLFLKVPKSLTFDEKILLKEYYSKHERGSFEAIINKEKILPFAACVLAHIGCDKEYWIRKHDSFLERNRKIKSIVDDVFLEMKTVGSKTLTLAENYGVVLLSNSCLGCFCSGDVDLYADPSEKEIIIKCLTDMGFIYENRSGRVTNYSEQVSMFFNPKKLNDGFWINILWTTTSRAFLIQEKYNERLAKERISAKQIDNSNIRVLSETSLMYFCALHIASGHYYTLSPGLRLYVDIDRLARAVNIDWDLILKWVDEDEAGIRVQIVMYIAHKLFKTPIPSKVFNEIFNRRRNRIFINYLLKSDTMQIQSKSSRLKRLYVELASDDNSFFTSILKRLRYYLKMHYQLRTSM
tara:strand:- start:996 stop:2078 length:1083 start_codon:yes stop_codon:yes gene_type:complete